MHFLYNIGKKLTTNWDLIIQGWTLYEIVRYIPEHNWIAYEQALKANPVLAKMAISGIVYSIGDWIAQVCFLLPKTWNAYLGHRVFATFQLFLTKIYRAMKESLFLSLIGHGYSDQVLLGLLSMDHFLTITTNFVRWLLCLLELELLGYILWMAEIVCMIPQALFPFQEWWVVPAKVAFDQTVWSAIWNSIYFVVLGLLRFESLTNIYGELKSTFLPLLTVSGYFICFFMLFSDVNCKCNYVPHCIHCFSVNVKLWRCINSILVIEPS